MSDLIARLSIDEGNLILDGNKEAPIYVGNNKLFEIVQIDDDIYVIGDNHTFLRIRDNLLVETMSLLAEACYRYWKYKQNQI